MKTMESREDYLECILVLSRQNAQTDAQDPVRSIDVAAHMGFTKASVSRAISLLKSERLVHMDDKTGALTLTKAGLTAAEHVYERHLLLTEFLVGLGVARAVAMQDACRMEHVISEESFTRIKETMTQDKRTNKGVKGEH